MADSRFEVSNTLSSAAFGDDLQLRGEERFLGDITGTFSGTIKVQATESGGSTYRDLLDPSTGVAYSITAPGIVIGYLPGSWDVHAGFSAYTSGSATIVIRPYPEKKH